MKEFICCDKCLLPARYVVKNNNNNTEYHLCEKHLYEHGKQWKKEYMKKMNIKERMKYRKEFRKAKKTMRKYHEVGRSNAYRTNK